MSRLGLYNGYYATKIDDGGGEEERDTAWISIGLTSKVSIIFIKPNEHQ